MLCAIVCHNDDFHEYIEPEGQIEMDDDSSLIYTSGTTGRPKGVVRSHQTNLWAALDTVIEMGYRFDDVELHTIPLFNVGFFNVFTPNIIVGGFWVFRRFCHWKFAHIITLSNNRARLKFLID